MEARSYDDLRMAALKKINHRRDGDQMEFAITYGLELEMQRSFWDEVTGVLDGRMSR